MGDGQYQFSEDRARRLQAERPAVPLDYDRRRPTPPPRFAAGRICAGPDCTTRLATDNPGEVCNPCIERTLTYPVVDLDRDDQNDPVTSVLADTIRRFRERYAA